MAESNSDNIVGKKEIASELEKIVVGRKDGKKEYFVKKKITTYAVNGRVEVEKEIMLYKCGHSPEKHPNFMQCDYSCIVCEDCIRYCQKGNHPICKMHAKELSDGRIFCKFHSSFFSFLKSPPFIVKRD